MKVKGRHYLKLEKRKIMSKSEVVVVERSDTWSEQDQSDLTSFSLQYAAKLYPEEENLVYS
ncbi:MAG: hypothetical protein F4Z85_17560 [Gemmatimonadetes bacterium]|nr:hypothetical protein [Gemmatimonadota bacterium]MYB70965.1 hypothetical protein [Gemmatimonadota bacterium]